MPGQINNIAGFLSPIQAHAQGVAHEGADTSTTVVIVNGQNAAGSSSLDQLPPGVAQALSSLIGGQTVATGLAGKDALLDQAHITGSGDGYTTAGTWVRGHKISSVFPHFQAIGRPVTTNNASQRDALKALDENYDAVAGPDGQVSLQDIVDAAHGLKGTGAVQQLGQYFMAHPEALHQLDTADKNSNGHADMVVSRGDVQARRATLDEERSTANREGVDILHDNFDSLKDADGNVTKKSLHDAALAGNKTAAELARYFDRNPDQFVALDTADPSGGRTPDGKLSMGDVQAAQSAASTPVDPQMRNNALQALEENFGAVSKDGVATSDSIQAAAAKPDANQHTKDMAKFFADHPDELKKLDTADTSGGTQTADGSISLGDVQAARAAAPTSTPVDPQMRRNALQALQDNFGDVSKNGFLTTDTLKDAAAKPEAKQAVKDAARFFSDHPDEFKLLDNADPSSSMAADGYVSLNDILTVQAKAQKA